MQCTRVALQLLEKPVSRALMWVLVLVRVRRSALGVPVMFQGGSLQDSMHAEFCRDGGGQSDSRWRCLTAEHPVCR